MKGWLMHKIYRYSLASDVIGGLWISLPQHSRVIDLINEGGLFKLVVLINTKETKFEARCFCLTKAGVQVNPSWKYIGKADKEGTAFFCFEIIHGDQNEVVAGT